MSKTNQTLAQVLNVAKATAADPTKKPEGTAPSFHEIQLQKKIDDPQNGAWIQAKAIGKANAEKFVKSATNPKDLAHETNFAVFNSLYGLDAKKVEKDFIDKECAERNAGDYEMKDPGYEATLFKKYTPVGSVKPAMYEFFKNFQSAMTDKWKKSGYKGDAEFIKNYSEKYGLKPNDNLSDLKEFQPKK